MKNVEVPKNINTKSKWTREREGGKARGEIETEEKKREQEKGREIERSTGFPKWKQRGILRERMLSVRIKKNVPQVIRVKLARKDAKVYFFYNKKLQADNKIN